MQFGIFDHLESRGGDLGALYEERLRMLAFADEAGFLRYHPRRQNSCRLSRHADDPHRSDTIWTRLLIPQRSKNRR